MSLDRAFRVIQHVPAPNEQWIVGWVNEYEPEWEAMPRSELVLSLVLTPATALLAEQCLSLWMRPESARRAIETFMRDRFINEGSSR